MKVEFRWVDNKETYNETLEDESVILGKYADPSICLILTIPRATAQEISKDYRKVESALREVGISLPYFMDIALCGYLKEFLKYDIYCEEVSLVAYELDE